MKNVDRATVDGFGDEWSRMPQDGVSEDEIEKLFGMYFSVFPWDKLPANARGCDFGCGSGRWARKVAPKVSHLTVLDASQDALEVAKKNLASCANVEAVHASVSDSPFPNASLDFAYSLGVLHHVPDTEDAIREISRVLKPGAPFLVYLYYAFDNRAAWFRSLWRVSDVARRGISRLPHGPRFAVSQVIAGLVYWPLARTGKVMEKLGALPDSWPLKFYANQSFYTMRTDALDRFGTQLEKRYTKKQCIDMLERNGFRDVRVSDQMPYWTLCGIRK